MNAVNLHKKLYKKILFRKSLSTGLNFYIISFRFWTVSIRHPTIEFPPSSCFPQKKTE